MHKTLPFLIGVLLLAGCTGPASLPEDSPNWLRLKVAEWTLLSDSSAPDAVYRYEYNGQTVYYFQARCCDRFNVAYDMEGQALCAPDGGVTGRGDGKCPDFKKTAIGGAVVWQAPRH